jgi:hypothetical protein
LSRLYNSGKQKTEIKKHAPRQRQNDLQAATTAIFTSGAFYLPNFPPQFFVALCPKFRNYAPFILPDTLPRSGKAGRCPQW